MVDSLELRIHAQREFVMNGISLHLFSRAGDRLAVAKPVEMVEREENSIISPMALLPMATAQQLMDELWNCGLRPTEGTGSAGSLAATERHLADMRKLAFHSLKVAG